MSVIDELKKLTRPYDDDDDLMEEDDFDEPAVPAYTQPAPQPQPQPQPAVQTAPAPQPEPITMASAPAASANTGFSSFSSFSGMGAANTSSFSAGSGIATDIAKYRVVLVSPETYEGVSAIAKHFRAGDAIILNCESTDKDVARRVVDFLSGCAFALDGTIKKAADKVYILVPRDVGVDETGEEEEI